MKIGWLQDQDPLLKSGGAQLNDAGMIEFGMKERGADIDIITPQNAVFKQDEAYDLLIFSNCVSFPESFMKEITQKYPYVIFHHDYFFCKFRLFFPGKESCKECFRVPFWREFMSKAMKNIFLSPLHRRMHEIVFDKKDLGAVVTIPSCVDLDFWKPNDKVNKKRNTVLSVHGLAPFKGRYVINDYITEHPELHFTFVGEGVQLQHKNVTYLGDVTRAKLRDLYWMNEYVMLLTETAQPFERVAAEALLCGNKILYNENIGFFSYAWDYKNREEVKKYLSQAPAGFWDEIYELFKNENRLNKS